MMQWILPMAGKGLRTQALGPFKPFIPVAGRLVVEWCLSGLSCLMGREDTIVCVTTREFAEDFSVARVLQDVASRLALPCVPHLVEVDETPPGPAMSVLAAFPYLREDLPCTVVNSDQFVQFDLPDVLSEKTVYLPLYVDFSGKSSYVSILDDGRICGIFEKQMCSFYASSGVYIFGSSHTLFNSIRAALRDVPPYRGEHYISHAVMCHIAAGGGVTPLSTLAKHDLGNVLSVQNFEKHCKPSN